MGIKNHLENINDQNFAHFMRRGYDKGSYNKGFCDTNDLNNTDQTLWLPLVDMFSTLLAFSIIMLKLVNFIIVIWVGSENSFLSWEKFLLLILIVFLLMYLVFSSPLFLIWHLKSIRSRFMIMLYYCWFKI